MGSTEQTIRECASRAGSRPDLWARFLNAVGARRAAEVGVFRGQFAAALLKDCPGIEKYYMLDPWRHLEDWNKPSNKDNATFEALLAEATAGTEFAATRRVILRGKTTEVIDRIPDGELDFAYIDGDHTLKGITIDLMRVLPKVRAGGWIGGDDFKRSVWQHDTSYEPTLVFPYAVYFAEAVGARIYALPRSQFLMELHAEKTFAYIDLTGKYADLSLREQFRPGKVLGLKLAESLSFLKRGGGPRRGKD